jgi:Domain of unknown function (DUF4926)
MCVEKMLNELDLVVLLDDLPDLKLRKGDVGTVVMRHENGTGFEVEFSTFSGVSVAVATLPASAVRAVGRREIAHAREVA